jgi:hypothetical protein
MNKGEAIVEAIRTSDVEDQIIIHNDSGMVWCVLKLICKEHEENEDKTDNSPWRFRKK